MTPNPPTLGSRLRAERTDRGLSLEQVSASTKISVALLEGLERDDLSRWPPGFYRRSFFRAYLSALGLEPEPFAGELAQLVRAEPSSEGSSTPDAVLTAAAPEEPLALVLAGVSAPGGSLSRRGLFAAVEAAAVMTAGSVVAWAGEMPLLTVIGLVALFYYPVIRTTSRGIGISHSFSRVESKSKPASSRSSVVALQVAARRSQAAIATGYLRLRQLHDHLVHFCRPVTEWMTTHVGDVLTHTRRLLMRLATRTWRGSKAGADTTRRVVSYAFVWTIVILWALSQATGRAMASVTTRGRRFTIRCLRAVNYAFWSGVRTAADRAQRLAMRRMAQTRIHFSGNGNRRSAAVGGVLLTETGVAPSQSAHGGALCSSAQASAGNT